MYDETIVLLYIVLIGSSFSSKTHFVRGVPPSSSLFFRASHLEAHWFSWNPSLTMALLDIHKYYVEEETVRGGRRRRAGGTLSEEKDEEDESELESNEEEEEVPIFSLFFKLLRTAISFGGQRHGPTLSVDP